MTKKRAKVVLAVALLFFAVVVALSLLPASALTSLYKFIARLTPVGSQWAVQHKATLSNIGHFLAYATLAFVLCQGARNKGRKLLLLFALSVLIEGVQYFTATRTFMMRDIVLNGAGILVGFVSGCGRRLRKD